MKIKSLWIRNHLIKRTDLTGTPPDHILQRVNRHVNCVLKISCYPHFNIICNAKNILPLCCFVSIICSLLLPGNSIAKDIGMDCSNTECHPEITSEKTTHPAKPSCSSCHELMKNKHPGQDKTILTLSHDSCQKCHQEIYDSKILHPPVAAGDCLVCHSVHGNEENHYIHEKYNFICYNCHDPVSGENDTVFHGEIARNSCSSCHNIHGSPFPKLLIANYSPDFFNDYNINYYELCFKCHKPDMLLHPNTSYNTKFRNGRRNLHYIHVNKTTKGRACKSCHEIHAGSLPHLVSSSVSFGNWQMPINFQPSENGGQCSPGCHKQENYDRRIKK